MSTSLPSVLILCYQFPPVNGTGARRPYYLARQLADEGHRVSVLTTEIAEPQPWLPNTAGIAVHRTPKTTFQRDLGPLQRILRKAYWDFQGKPGHGIIRLLADLMLPEGHIDRWDILPEEVEAALGSHDIVLATCPSWYPFRLAAKLATRWNAMFVADYRDPWTIRIPTLHLRGFTQFGTGLAGWLRKKKMERAERRWPGKAYALTAISQPLLDNAALTTSVCRKAVVHGGYDPLLTPLPYVRNKHFTLVYTGRVYDQQDWTAVLDAIVRLHDDDPSLSTYFRLKLFGAVSTNRELLDRMDSIGARTGALELMPRLGRDETLDAQRSADALLHISLDDHLGSLPVKFLEYLGAGRPILLFIKSPDLESEVVRTTRTGIQVTSGNEFETALRERLAAWRLGAAWRIEPDAEQLKNFDYSVQMQRWAEQLRVWYRTFSSTSSHAPH